MADNSERSFVHSRVCRVTKAGWTGLGLAGSSLLCEYSAHAGPDLKRTALLLVAPLHGSAALRGDQWKYTMPLKT